MPYIIGTFIVLLLFVILVDRNRLREFYPTYLFTIVVGHVFDRVAVYLLKIYDYTDPMLDSHIITLLVHTLYFPPIAVLFIQYAERINLWVLILSLSVVGTLHEWWFFVRTGELTYYQWNLFFSFLGYVIWLVSVYWQYRWYVPALRQHSTS